MENCSDLRYLLNRTSEEDTHMFVDSKGITCNRYELMKYSGQLRQPQLFVS